MSARRHHAVTEALIGAAVVLPALQSNSKEGISFKRLDSINFSRLLFKLPTPISLFNKN